MKKIFNLFIILIILLFPLTAYAEWVDADRSGQEGVVVYTDSSDSGYTQVALDTQNRPHIAFVQTESSFPPTYYLCHLYWNGSAWVDADGSGQESMRFASYATFGGGVFSFDVDALDRPGVAFASAANLAYLYWNGSAWVDADGTGQESIIVVPNQSVTPSLRFKSDNRPAIAFEHSSGGGGPYNMSYLYWNGSAWVDADGTGQESMDFFIDAGTGMYATSLRIGSLDRPLVAWQYNFGASSAIYFLQWNGSAWVDADGTGQGDIAVPQGGNGTMPSLEVNPSNYPLIAWQDNDPGNLEIYFLQWNGSAWVDADGTGQGDINVSQDSGYSRSPSLVINPKTGQPAIVFYDNTLDASNPDIYFLQWNGSLWADVNGIDRSGVVVFDNDFPSTINRESRALAFDQENGYPHLAWDNIALGQNDPYYLEWWIERPAPVLPQTGNKPLLIEYLNQILEIG